MTGKKTDVASRPTVLVVDDDAAIRRLVRTGLELEHLRVLEAASLAQAKAVVAEPVDGVVLEPRLADGDGMVLVPELVSRWPQVRIVLHGSHDDDSFVAPAIGGAGLPAAARGDVDGIVDALGLRVRLEAWRRPEFQVSRAQAEVLGKRWAELCRWDPALPPDSEPALARSMVQAVADALVRPQPLGWGLDPALASTAEAFAVNAGGIGAALAQLVCLHEAFVRSVIDEVPLADRDEARERLDMIIHRTMVVVGQTSVAHLAEEALTDPLTGISNRRAFELHMKREVSRAERHGRPLTVAIIDLDGLKAINDRWGHNAGDDALRAMAGALRSTARHEDGAYRIGGDEFALILVDAEVTDPDTVFERLRAAGAPPFSLGLAAIPADPADDLVARADERLYERRRRRR